MYKNEVEQEPNNIEMTGVDKYSPGKIDEMQRNEQFTESIED